jgi:acyl-CoA dehydrogenase
VLALKPLHTDTLAGLQAEAEAALHLTFYAAELTGREESRELDERGARLLRLLTPLMKLTTARAAVSVASETIEAFGGAGYVEDTGLPVLLRDAQVLSIWEGTTNVLSLDALRTATKDSGALASLKEEIERCARGVRDTGLAWTARAALYAATHAEGWLATVAEEGQDRLEAGARRFALTLGRALSLALLTRHAQWSLEEERDARASAAARRFALNGVDLITDSDPEDAAALMEER